MAETGIIDRYRIIRELGRGGMATVYLAHDPRFRRDVAIKVLPRQFTHDPRFLERFTQEAQLIAALEHPAIVPVHDFGEYADAPYLVMRYMAGGGLRQRLAGGPLPPAEVVRILDRLAPALDKAHARGVIHRDIKPDNVLFDEDDLPYLADFGIARMAEATQTMTIVGTPAYMSPEQVQGDITLDARSDIYALGVVLYEMLSGRQPYKADTPTKQMLKHVLEPIPDVCAANPALPPACRALIERAMAKQPAARYQTAAELAAAVRDLAAPQAIKPAPVDLAALTVLDAAPERTGDGGQAAPPAEFKSPAITELESPPRAAGVEEPAQSALDTPPAIDTPPVRTPPSSTAQHLYERLKGASQVEDWETVLALGAQLDAIQPHYRDVAELLNEAAQQLKPSPKPARTTPARQPVKSADTVSKAPAPRLRSRMPKLPQWVWWGGAIIALVLVIWGISKVLMPIPELDTICDSYGCNGNTTNDAGLRAGRDLPDGQRGWPG
jgi:serine/threonine protein kinase